MDLSQKLHDDIRTLEEELNLIQDEKVYNDKSEYYLLNRLAELRIINVQRKIIKQGEDIMKLDTKHDSPEMKMQIESVRSQIKEEEEKNFELENQYTMFANVYLGQDNSTRGEMSKILNEYASEGMEISPDIIDKTDEYMFDNYAFTDEKMKKSNSDSSGGLGIGLEQEEDYEQ